MFTGPLQNMFADIWCKKVRAWFSQDPKEYYLEFTSEKMKISILEETTDLQKEYQDHPIEKE